MSRFKASRYKEDAPKKKGGWIYTVLIVFFAAVFCVSAFFIVKELLADSNTEQTLDSVLSMKPVEKNESSETVTETETDPKAVYSIGDFSSFTAENTDTVGWFYMPTSTSSKGLPIDLPLLWREGDSKYYLTRDFYKRDSENGWVYIAGECSGNDITASRNLLIYGHARSYKMFGGLKNLNLDSAWKADPDSHYIKISTPYEDSVWEIFSWHETDIYDFYWQTDFASDAEFLEFANRVQSQDQLGCFTKFEFTAEDRIMTLSTCKTLDPNKRVAVHAKLIVSVPKE